MAASPKNPWWYDLLRRGRESAYASYFDVDWTKPKLTLPILGQPYGSALAYGEFSLGHDASGLTLRYFDHSLPLDPRTWQLVFGEIPLDEPEAFGSWCKQADNEARLTVRLAEITRDKATLHRVHEAQSWRLVYWRAARDALSYRRFFEISDLVGVRVEDERVFDDVHRFLFELVDRGDVDGVRVDHIDGLADPAAYLDRLKKELPRPIPVWVEKILAEDEDLPTSWSIVGSTGYEFAATVARALTHQSSEPDINSAYTTYVDEPCVYPAMRDAAKSEIISRNLASELERLTRLAEKVFSLDLANRDWGVDSLRRALAALLCALPVYRTYLTANAASQEDRAVLSRAANAARDDPHIEDPAIIDALVRCLTDGEGSDAQELRVRFQQTAGGLMAKGVEDTLFYRFNRLISANEVGGDPEFPGASPADFHRAMIHRANRQPGGLSATATHDTKRGEDARMRIAAISEAPEDWSAAVSVFDAAVETAGS